MIDRIKTRLVDNVNTLHKRWSVHLSVIGGMLISLSQIAPQSYYDLPQWARDVIPPSFVPWVGVSLIVLSVVAQAIKQKSLNKGDDDASSKAKE